MRTKQRKGGRRKGGKQQQQPHPESTSSPSVRGPQDATDDQQQAPPMRCSVCAGDGHEAVMQIIGALITEVCPVAELEPQPQPKVMIEQSPAIFTALQPQAFLDCPDSYTTMTCVSCGGIALNPLNFECDCIVCERCAPLKDGLHTCPCDKHATCAPGNFNRQLMHKIGCHLPFARIACPNRCCAFVGSMQEWAQHTCVCIKGCGKPLKPTCSEQTAHITDECPKRMVACTLCQDLILAVDMDVHCSGAKKACANARKCDACRTAVRFDALEQHVKSICPYVYVPCDMCQQLVPRRALEQHKRTDVQCSQVLFMRWFSSLPTAPAELKQIITTTITPPETSVSPLVPSDSSTACTLCKQEVLDLEAHSTLSGVRNAHVGCKVVRECDCCHEVIALTDMEEHLSTKCRKIFVQCSVCKANMPRFLFESHTQNNVACVRKQFVAAHETLKQQVSDLQKEVEQLKVRLDKQNDEEPLHRSDRRHPLDTIRVVMSHGSFSDNGYCDGYYSRC